MRSYTIRFSYEGKKKKLKLYANSEPAARRKITARAGHKEDFQIRSIKPTHSELFDFNNSNRLSQERRQRELDLLNSYTGPIITHVKRSQYECRECKKVLKNKHPKHHFRIIRDGKPKRRIYCEECVEDIPLELFVKLEFVRVF